MKKYVFTVIVLTLLFCTVSAEHDIYRAADGVEVQIADFSFEEFAKSMAQGEGMPVKTLGENVTDFLLSEVKTALSMLGTAVALAVLSGIVGGMCFGKEGEGITFFICLALIAGTAVTGFSAIGKMAEGAVKNMSVFLLHPPPFSQ